jgi:hypothetical protein
LSDESVGSTTDGLVYTNLAPRTFKVLEHWRKCRTFNEGNGRNCRGHNALLYMPLKLLPKLGYKAKNSTVRTSRFVLECKLGRPLENWEETRHMDGDPTNNHFDNLESGCHLMNILDDYFTGKRAAPFEEIERCLDSMKLLHETLNRRRLHSL